MNYKISREEDECNYSSSSTNIHPPLSKGINLLQTSSYFPFTKARTTFCLCSGVVGSSTQSATINTSNFTTMIINQQIVPKLKYQNWVRMCWGVQRHDWSQMWTHRSIDEHYKQATTDVPGLDEITKNYPSLTSLNLSPILGFPLFHIHRGFTRGIT